MADELSRVFAALADPTRRDIVARLTVGDATVGEFAAPYDVSLQAVSKHLKVLEDAGLVTRSRDAQRRPVHLEAEVFDLMTAGSSDTGGRPRSVSAASTPSWPSCTTTDDATPATRPTRRSSIMTTAPPTAHEATIEAHPTSPIINIIRDFDAPPEQLLPRLHRPRPVRRWIGPAARDHRIDYWDCRRGGRCRYGTTATEEYGVLRLVPRRAPTTASCRPSPSRACPTASRWRPLTFEDLGDGRTRLPPSRCATASRTATWLRSGMEIGVNDGYAALDRLLADGTV